MSGEPVTANAEEVRLSRVLASVEQLLGGEIGVLMCSGLRSIERSFGRWRSVFRPAGLVFGVHVGRLLNRLPHGFDG